MVIYTLNLFISTILNFLSRKADKKLRFILTICAVLVVSIVAGIRYNVGTDYKGYVEWFYQYAHGPIVLNGGNNGFNILVKIIRLFSNNPQWLFFLSGLIINGLMMKFIKDNTMLYDLGYFLFITLYFYYSSLNIMRQWIAIVIFLYALKFAYERNIFKYFLWIIIAASFHTTALLTLPVYFIINIKSKIKFSNIIIITLSSFIFITQFQKIIVYLSSKLTFLNMNKYLSYFDGKFAISEGNGWAYFVIVLMVLVLMLIYKEKYINTIDNANCHYIMMILALNFSLFSTVNMIFARVQLYFIPIILITLPNLVEILKPKDRVIVALVIVLLGILYMYRSLLINGGQVMPYRTIFTI